MADAHDREVRKDEAARGRTAPRPGKIPRPGWRDILLRVKHEQSDDNLAIIAAGVAFYWLLAVFPAMAGLIAIYGLVTEPQQVQEQIQTVSRLLPQQAQAVIANQATRIAEQSADTLQLAAVLGFLGALWSSAKGVKALMQSLNIAYDEEEERGFFKLNGLALLLTLGALILGVVALGLVVALSPLLGNIGLGFAARTIVNILRWPVLAALAIFALGVVYRYGADREPSGWRWVNVGAVTATVLWLAASGLFSWYVALDHGIRHLARRRAQLRDRAPDEHGYHRGPAPADGPPRSLRRGYRRRGTLKPASTANRISSRLGRETAIRISAWQ